MARYNQTPENRCMPLSEWPTQDQAAWQAALTPAGFLEAGGVAAAWSPGGRQMVVVGYGHWLSWLDRTRQLAPATTPASRVTQVRVTDYLESMLARLAPLTVQGRIGQLGRALRALAPGQEWTWLSRAADWLRAGAAPVREKRARMQDAQRLIDLGMSLMQRAQEADDHSVIQHAALYRDGLMIALLAHRPLRLRSFAAITLDEHLVKQKRNWWLSFSPSDVKTKQRLDMPFPETLIEALELYLAEHRPVLIRGRRKVAAERPVTAGLWIAKGGAMMGASAISVQIKSRTESAFGKPVNPHLFRDCVATSIAIQDPDHVRMIVPLLGNATLGTSARNDNQAKTLEAAPLPGPGRAHTARATATRSSK